MMTRLPIWHPIRSVALLAAFLLTLALPMAVLGHAELKTSDPAEGSTVEAPFAGPIVMTFTEAVASESRAELIVGAGKVAATTGVDGTTITLTPDVALTEGEYEVRWTSVADDGHIERGTIRFTVVAAATPQPSATPTPTPAPSAGESVEPSASATTAPSTTPAASAPAPSGGTDATGTTSSGGDVLLPIIAGALLVGALAVFVLRRRDSTSTPS